MIRGQMRVISLILAAIVGMSLYFLVVDRETLIIYVKKLSKSEELEIKPESTEVDLALDEPTKTVLPHVIVSKSKAIKANNVLVLRGKTAASRKVEVRAEISGAVISSPRPKGSSIETGETLCEIAAGTRFVTLSEAKTRLSEAEEKFDVAKTLTEQGYSTKTSNLTQETLLESAKASLKKAEYEISKLIIHAPFAGVLENNTAELGSYLNQGSLCGTIIDLSQVKLIGYVPEVKIREISVGAKAAGKTVSGITTDGLVSFISKRADPITKTFQVEIIAENYDSNIRDGETVEIAIELEANTAHLLPQSVLTLNDEGSLGVRAVIEGEVKFYEVNILRDQINGLLLTGLPETIDVITVGQEFVLSGQKVNVTYEKSE
ncbi:MAG: efflux RND transporter periplasmic adaptor subunit [Rhodobacteraceae bacterium]|nr:MAG: efflux RND transporter periplasmic adaptor subunit [Paracoccaceae bacterium]|tara:strand:- start:2292 stop:3422 length:1131 start_codon:yes stop_codon:yes gene_type:complete